MSFTTLDTYKSTKTELLPRLKLPLTGTIIRSHNGIDSDRSKTEVSMSIEPIENFQYLLAPDYSSYNPTMKRNYSRDILRTREATSLNQLMECKSIGDLSERLSPRSTDVTIKSILKISRLGNSEIGGRMGSSFVRPKKVRRVTFSDEVKNNDVMSEELLSKFQWSTPKAILNPEAADRPSFEATLKKDQDKTVPGWLAPIPPAIDILNKIKRSKERKIASFDMSAKNNTNAWQIENMNQKGIKFVQKETKNPKLPPIMPCFLGIKENQNNDQELFVESLIFDTPNEKKMRATGAKFLTPEKQTIIRNVFSLTNIWRKTPEAKNNDKNLFERVN